MKVRQWMFTAFTVLGTVACQVVCTMRTSKSKSEAYVV